MPKRYFGTNGIRFRLGVDKDLTFVVEMSRAIAEYCRGDIAAVGRDGRWSSPTVFYALASAFLSASVDIVDLGLLPTPALQYFTKQSKGKGVMITASHNPPEYCGIKVMGEGGVEISREDEEKIESIYESGSSQMSRRPGTLSTNGSAVTAYINAIISQVNSEAIRRRRLTVVLDLGNGAQCVAAPYLLEKLRCKVFTVNGHIDGGFPGRGSEPKRETLTALSETVRTVGADFGVAFDGDGDRSVFCDEKGAILWGDQSSTIIADHIIQRTTNPTIVTSVSASQMIDDISRRKKARVIRTAVGSVDISHRMIKENAIFGFEENGGCFYLPHLAARDGGMTTALMLEALSTGRTRMSQLVNRLPRYAQGKMNVPCPDHLKQRATEEITSHATGRVEYTDGVKIWLDEKSWILMRPSGTEPLIRLYCESDHDKKTARILSEHAELVKLIVEKMGRGAPSS
jgi:phosphomannomutase/phosphoglucomutase